MDLALERYRGRTPIGLERILGWTSASPRTGRHHRCHAAGWNAIDSVFCRCRDNTNGNPIRDCDPERYGYINRDANANTYADRNEDTYADPFRYPNANHDTGIAGRVDRALPEPRFGKFTCGGRAALQPRRGRRALEERRAAAWPRLRSSGIR